MIEHYLEVNGETMAVGYDISHHNSDNYTINWDTLDAMYLYIKSSQGFAFVDDKYSEHCKQADARSIPRGAYHFYDYRYPDGLPQAQQMVKCVGDSCGILPPAVDFETQYENVGTKKKPKMRAIPLPARNLIHNELMELGTHLQKTYGVKPMLYIGNLLKWLKPDEEMRDLYTLWIAQWNYKQDLPLYGYENYTIWQRIGDVAIPGQPGVWDINYMRKSDYLSLIGTNPVTVPVIEPSFEHWYDDPKYKAYIDQLVELHDL